MNSAIISLGSNSAGRDLIIERAINVLRGQFDLRAVSEIYEAQDEEYAATPYSNAVISLLTPLDHDSMRDCLKKTERDFGRTPQSKQSRIVPLDIDIIVFNDTVMRPRDYNKQYFRTGLEMIQ